MVVTEMLYGKSGVRGDISELLIAVQSLQHLRVGLNVIAQQKTDICAS